MNRKHVLYQTCSPMNAAPASAAGEGRGITAAVLFLVVAIGFVSGSYGAEPRTGNDWAFRNLQAREDSRDEMADLDLEHNYAVLSNLLADEGMTPQQIGRLMRLEQAVELTAHSNSRLPLMTMDPWGKPYLYWASVGGFVLISTGRDGKQQAPYAEWLASDPEDSGALRRALGCNATPPRDRGDDLIYTTSGKCP